MGALMVRVQTQWVRSGVDAGRVCAARRGVEVRIVNVTVGIMARSGSSPSESLFGVDLKRGQSESENLTVLHFYAHTHTTTFTRFEQRANVQCTLSQD